MKKYPLTTADVHVEPFFRKNVIYLRAESNVPYQICEETGNYETYTEQDYLNSLNNRRLLRMWEQYRPQVNVAPHLPDIIRVIIYENAFDDLQPLILQSYQERSSQPIDMSLIQSFLVQMGKLANRLQRHNDAVYWEELHTFCETCYTMELLTNSFQRASSELE